MRFFTAEELKNLLAPFITPGGEILSYPRGNFLIIIDLPSNIERLLEIRNLIDVQVFAGVRVELYQPKVAGAEDLAAEMTRVMQAYGSSAALPDSFAAQFIPIPRINQVLVVAHSEAAWLYVKRWLERVDVVAEGIGRRIFVYPVENGKATDLADILNQVLSGKAASSRRDATSVREFHRGESETGSTPEGGTGSSTSGLYAAAQAQPRVRHL